MCANITRLCLFSIQRQGTSVWRALSSISAWKLAAMETTRQKVANCSRLLPLRLESHDRQSSSASIAKWQAPPCLMIEVAVENLRRSHEWARSTGTVVWYHAGSEKRALPYGTLFSPELVAIEGCGVTTELRDRTFEPSRSVTWAGGGRLVVQTEVDRATCWADRQKSRLRNPDASKPWKRRATGELVWTLV